MGYTGCLVLLAGQAMPPKLPKLAGSTPNSATSHWHGVTVAHHMAPHQPSGSDKHSPQLTQKPTAPGHSAGSTNSNSATPSPFWHPHPCHNCLQHSAHPHCVVHAGYDDARSSIQQHHKGTMVQQLQQQRHRARQAGTCTNAYVGSCVCPLLSPDMLIIS